MRQVLNIYLNGEELYIPIPKENILDAEDKEGKHKVIDLRDTFIHLDQEYWKEAIGMILSWFRENGLDLSLAADFFERIYDIKLEVEYE